MTPTAKATTKEIKRDIAVLKEQVERQLDALSINLRATLNRAQFGERCIVVVDKDRYY